MSQLTKVFISHSHTDAPLAEAFRDTFRNLFKQVEVAFSSDKELGGGPTPGGNWLNWIHSQVLDCQETLLLLTPDSVQKPWPMWEAGAVGGVALATLGDGDGEKDGDDASAKALIPIRLNLRQDQLPGPFVVTQAYDGTSKEGLHKLFGDLMKKHDYRDHPDNVIKAGLKDEIPSLQSRVNGALKNIPALVTEGIIQEWCARLDKLSGDNRSSEVAHLHRWIELAFMGPRRQEGDEAWGKQETATPWDLRLHLRLGENYFEAGMKEEGVAQYELASRLAPLDVYVLHKLGKAYLDIGNREKARKTLDRILELDPDAIEWNAEVAGLEGRYWKEIGLEYADKGEERRALKAFTDARDAYEKALGRDQDSYYLADNVGQLNMRLGDKDGWCRAYEQAETALKKVEANVWSLATGINAALALGQDEQALELIRSLHRLHPSDGQLRTIEGGLRVVLQGLGKDQAKQDEFVGALRSPAEHRAAGR